MHKVYPSKTGVSEEEFKFLIIDQLKDPDSAFCCLLSGATIKDRQKSFNNNFVRKDVVLYASEFDLRLVFQWDKNIEHKSRSRTQFPVEKGGHSVRFEKLSSDESIKGRDLTRGEWLNDITFYQEAIFASSDNPSSQEAKENTLNSNISFGLESFKIQHTGYIFHKEFDGKTVGEISFDCHKKAFSTHYRNGMDAWTAFSRWSSKKADKCYLDFSLSDNNFAFIEKAMHYFDVEENVQRIIYESVLNPDSSACTRLSRIVDALSKKLETCVI